MVPFQQIIKSKSNNIHLEQIDFQELTSYRPCCFSQVVCVNKNFVTQIITRNMLKQ